jgi:hypothetical protein
VVANILFICDTGPYKKQVENKPRRFPIVYIIANGSGSPFNSLTRRKVLPMEIIKPIAMQMKQPEIRCCHVKEGQTAQSSSSHSTEEH